MRTSSLCWRMLNLNSRCSGDVRYDSPYRLVFPARFDQIFPRLYWLLRRQRTHLRSAVHSRNPERCHNLTLDHNNHPSYRGRASSIIFPFFYALKFLSFFFFIRTLLLRLKYHNSTASQVIFSLNFNGTRCQIDFCTIHSNYQI